MPPQTKAATAKTLTGQPSSAVLTDEFLQAVQRISHHFQDTFNFPQLSRWSSCSSSSRSSLDSRTAMSHKVILPADEDGNPNSSEEAHFAFVFDTTASNTGRVRGAYRLQKMLYNAV